MQLITTCNFVDSNTAASMSGWSMIHHVLEAQGDAEWLQTAAMQAVAV